MPTNHALNLKAALEHPYQKNVCFLCATPLSKNNSTKEHVFPKWLQDRFDLWDSELVLTNQSTIRYKQIKIPCCFKCNNNHLSPIEKRVAAATLDGYAALNRLPKFELFIWIAKIYLGILYKELSLLADRKNPNSGTLISAEFIRRYSILHFWLQMKSCANDPKFTPGSLWIFRCQVPSNLNEQFDLKDDAKNGVIAIRIGSVAIVADFLENGVHKKINAKQTRRLSKIELHPLQFQELVALIVYEASLIDQESEIEFFKVAKKLVYTIKWQSTVDGGAAMRPWDRSAYAKVLSFYTRFPSEMLFYPPNQLMTWLHGPDGKFVYWPIGQPHPYAYIDPNYV